MDSLVLAGVNTVLATHEAKSEEAGKAPFGPPDTTTVTENKPTSEEMSSGTPA